MRARRGRHTSRFVQVPNSTAQDTRLSFRAAGLLLAVLSLPEGADRPVDSFASQGSREGRDAVRTAFRELLDAGYARRVRRQDPDGTWHTDTDVWDSPASAAEAEVEERGDLRLVSSQGGGRDTSQPVSRPPGRGDANSQVGPTTDSQASVKIAADFQADDVDGPAGSQPGEPTPGEPTPGEPTPGEPTPENPSSSTKDGFLKNASTTPSSSLRSEERPPGGSDDDEDDGLEPTPPNAKATRIPDRWRPEGALREWTLRRIIRELGVTEAEAEEIARRWLVEFRRFWLAEGGQRARKKDWRRTWQNRVDDRCAHQQRPGRPGSGARGPSERMTHPNPTQAGIDAWTNPGADSAATDRSAQ